MPQRAQKTGCGRPADPMDVYVESMKSMMEWSPMAPMMGLRWRLGEVATASFAAMGFFAPAAKSAPASSKPVLKLVEKTDPAPVATADATATDETATAAEDDTPATTVGDVLSGTDVADDLTLISGIGPATARKLNDMGIRTFSQMSAMAVEDLLEMRRDIGPGVSEELAQAQIAEAASLAGA